MLTTFEVMPEDWFGIGRGVTLQCFDGGWPVLIFVTHEAIEDRFGRRRLTRPDSYLLVAADREAIEWLANEKYRARDVERHVMPSGQPLPLVVVTARDIPRLAPRAMPSMAPEVAAAAAGVFLRPEAASRS